MKVLDVLIACEFSGIVRDAFLLEGHNAFSCDLLPTESNATQEKLEHHIQGDVLEILDIGWDLMIAHPPCTYLTNAGVRHLHEDVSSRNNIRAKINGPERWMEMCKGADFFNALWNAPIARICVENPIPHSYAVERIGKYDQLIQPWQFGHDEVKAICFWLKNLPPLQPTNIRSGRAGRVHSESPGPERAKNRSRFFIGVAKAMAQQWGHE